jgi:hypothetical protein
LEVKGAGYFCILTPIPRACEQCGSKFHAQRTTARFCSARCRVAHHRQQ